MAAPLKLSTATPIARPDADLGARARAAARMLALAPPEQKNAALAPWRGRSARTRRAILAANAEDIAEARAARHDRLLPRPPDADAGAGRGMAEGIGIVRGIADPVGDVTESWQRPNGMTIERVRMPLGVIGVIYRKPAERRRPMPARCA